MALKERYQNPAIGDEIRLRVFAYNSNARTDFYAIEKVELYYLDPNGQTESNPDGRTLVDTITSITHTATGEYEVTTTLTEGKYSIGRYLDIWYVKARADDPVQTIKNLWEVMPDLWYTTPFPIVYDFSFVFRPNKIRIGSKKYLCVEITPNVPKSTDLERIYNNLAIVSPLKISMVQTCGDCLPTEYDLRVILDKEPVALREKNAGYYLLDTAEMKEGMYDVWFEMEFGDSVYVSDKQQLQVYA